MKNLMTKFPVWMGASTLFFGVTRSITDLKDRVIELDSAVVNLRRVMDVPEVEFNTVIERAIENVTELSGKTMDYMQLVGDFGRTGLSMDESIDMANTATLLQNISELTAEESFDALTSAMISYNIQAEESVDIANKLNEVDNNYAITTRDLGLSLNKAASTAKTFGVSLDELLGYTTAIGSATRETGNIVGHSLKTIFSRITTNSKAINALEEIGISINNLEGDVKPVGDIITELGEKWNTLSDAERQRTSIGVAGTHQLSRFNALMLNYKMSVDSTETSLNSYNSAMREQEEYDKSLEARINTLNTAWVNFANTVGETVMYDSIVVITEGLTKLTDSGEGVAGTIGTLAPAFGILGMAIYTVSTSLRAYVATTYATVSANVAATGATGALAGAMTLLNTATRLAFGALKMLGIATGIGILFAGVGFAIEKVINKMSDFIQKSEDIDLYFEKNTKAMSENKKEVNALIDSYLAMDEAKKNGDTWNSDKEEEYLQVQQTLSEVFPALVSHIDSSGQAHLKNKDAIDKEIQSTMDLVDAQSKLNISEALESFEDLKTSMDGNAFSSWENFLGGSLKAQIDNLKSVIEHNQELGIDTSKFEYELMNLEQQYAFASQEIVASIFTIANATNSLNDVEIDSDIINSLQEFVSTLDLSKMDASQLASFSKGISSIQEQMQKAIDTEDKGLYLASIDGLEQLASMTSEYKSELNPFTVEYEKMKSAIEGTDTIHVDVNDTLSEGSDLLSESSESASDLKATYDDLSDSIERLVGASSEGIESVSDLFFEYDMLSQSLEGLFQALRLSDAEFKNLTNQELIATLTGKDLTFEQQQLKDAYEARKKVLDELGQVFPDIIAQEEYALDLSSQSVEAARIENEAKRALGKAYQIMKDDILDAEQEASFNKINQTNTRIEAIKAELKALQNLSLAYSKFAEAQTKLDAGAELSHNEQMAMMYGSNFIDDGTSDSIRELNEALNIEIKALDASTKSFDKATVARKESSSATKDSSKANKENTDTLDAEELAQEALNKVTEKYTLTLEKLANAQKKVQNNQKKYGTYSKKYRELLAEENKLLAQQIELNKQQATDLEALNGKTYTSVTYNSDSGQIYGNGQYLINNGKLAGWGGQITDTFATRGGTHRGVDVDGIKGEDLASNVAGKVIKTGWHDLSGNFIEIMEAATGYIHRYAHLDKITVAVDQLVDVGNKIGTIGNTGRVKSSTGDGSHLHYETMDANRKLLDPMSYVQKAKKSTYSSPTVNVNVSNTSSSSGKASTMNEQIIWDFFKNNGFSDAASAGIIGNLRQESSLSSSAVQKNGKGRGLLQWSEGERWSLLQDWAKSNGKDAWDINTQLEYILKELMGTDKDKYSATLLNKKGGLDALKNATSVSQVTALFEQVMTRAGKPMLEKRTKYAQDALNRLGGTGASSTGQGVIADGYYTETMTHTLNTLSEIEALRAENSELADKMQENYYKQVQSRVEQFQRSRDYEDNVINAETSRQEQLDVASKEYENSLNKQFNSEKNKLKMYEQELSYIKAIRDAGGLTDIQSDQLKDRIKEIEIAILESTNSINDFYYENVEAHTERYARSRDALDKEIATQESRQVGLSIDSESFEKSVNKQYAAEKRKLALYEGELKYLQKILVLGKLTDAQSVELKDKIHEIQVAMNESGNQVKEYYSTVVSSYLARFDTMNSKFADTLAWEETKITSVDIASDRYTKTLEKMIVARKGQVSASEKELAYIEKILKSGELTTSMYDELSERVKELKKELINMNEALHQTNYELIQVGVSVRAEELDDVDFKINRSQKIRSLYEEGSADYKKEMDFELEQLEKKLQMLWENGEKIQFDMRGKDLGHQQLKDLEEQLEDNALAYWDVKNAISSLKKEMEDFNKIVDDKVAEQRGDVIEKVIDALKDAYEELKEIKMSEIDELIDIENERHDKVMKNYRDELESFTKIIDAQRRQLDDEDRDRTHNMNVNELTDEKQDLQKRLNLISHVNTFEAKKEREELQKQIAEIDKQIMEEYYQYERELRLQQLDDALDAKTEQIEDLEEAEDKHNQEVSEDLNKQKSYWEKHYSDLINDEERWRKYRKIMMDGDKDAVKELLDSIQLEFDTLSAELTASLPKLEDTFDGTWKAVGTQIRENVIDNLKLVMDEIKKVEEEAQKLLNLKDTITMENGSSWDNQADKTITDEDSGKITEANLKVILAKFMNEQIAGKLNPETDMARIKNIKEKSYALAAEGRAEGANIAADKSLRDVFDGLNTDQVKQVGDYFANNAEKSGFITQDYIDYITKFGQTAQQGSILTYGDKQVLMAKYLKEKLANESKNADEKAAIRSIADNMAASGRANTSLIKANVGYDEQVRKLSAQQREELGLHMTQHASAITSGEMRSKLEDYAKRLHLTYTDDMVHLDVGGMTRAFGSTGGVDGKGGKMAVLHQNEIVSNPLDTKRLLQTSAIMESVMSSIKNIVKSPINNIKSMLKPNEQASINTEPTIVFQVENMNATKSEVESFAKQIQKRLFREKGRS